MTDPHIAPSDEKTGRPKLLRSLAADAASIARLGWPMTAALWLVLTATLGSGVAGGWTPAIMALLLAAALGAILARVAGKPLVPAVSRTLLASVLMAFVLGFFLLLSVMAGGFAAFAVMAGTGFDFDAAGAGPDAFRTAFDAFLETPGGQVAQAVFWVAMVIWAVALGRALPYAAATVESGRMIVLEAFNRSRGRALVFTGLLLVSLLPAGLVVLVAASIGGRWFGAALTSFALVFAVVGLASASRVADRV